MGDNMIDVWLVEYGALPKDYIPSRFSIVNYNGQRLEKGKSVDVAVIGQYKIGRIICFVYNKAKQETYAMVSLDGLTEFYPLSHLSR